MLRWAARSQISSTRLTYTHHHPTPPHTGHVVLATRDTLVGQYVGHTGPKTKEVIKQALGGILFIDEAYYLYNAGNDRDYGVESIEILLKVGCLHRVGAKLCVSGRAGEGASKRLSRYTHRARASCERQATALVRPVYQPPPNHNR